MPMLVPGLSPGGVANELTAALGRGLPNGDGNPSWFSRDGETDGRDLQSRLRLLLLSFQAVLLSRQQLPHVRRGDGKLRAADH